MKIVITGTGVGDSEKPIEDLFTGIVDLLLPYGYTDYEIEMEEFNEESRGRD